MIARRRIDIPGIPATIECRRPFQREHYANLARDVNVMRPANVSHMNDIYAEMSGFPTRFDRPAKFDATGLTCEKPSLAFTGMDQPAERVVHLGTIAEGIIQVGC